MPPWPDPRRRRTTAPPPPPKENPLLRFYPTLSREEEALWNNKTAERDRKPYRGVQSSGELLFWPKRFCLKKQLVVPDLN